MAAQQLSGAISYDPKTGEFRWAVKRANKNIGDLAGNVGPNGYRTIMVDRRFYYAHHLAYLLMEGALPSKGTHVDHLNGRRDDNRWANLRVTTPSKNGLNRSRPNKNNSTGVLGITRKRNRFVAKIQVNGTNINIGYFRSIEEAKAAREAALASHCWS